MLSKILLNRASILALAAAMAATAGAASADIEIGAVAAVNRDIEGTPPGGSTRALLLGDRLIANERLISSPIGSGQMLFLDQTSLTVSPNSDIVLDKYVYDPATETGEIGVTVARGVMRMIGGRITKNTDGVVKTPSATIGIRGGIALVVVDDANTTRIMHVAGEYTRVTAGDSVLNLSRSNGLATVSGGVLEYNGVASEEQIAALYDQMQGGGGGSEENVDSEAVEGSGVADVNSEEPDAVTREPISTAGESAVADGSAETEQLNLASDTEIQISVQDDQVLGNPFEGFVGGAVVAERIPFTDAFGDTIDDPVAQNFVIAGDGQSFTSVRQGSVIGTLEDGGEVRLPQPAQSGFFLIDPAETRAPNGDQFGGAGFADIEDGFFTYYILTQEGDIGASVAAAPGPTQLRSLNVGQTSFRATSFRILPDLHIADSLSTVPFLPAGVGEFFDNGQPTQMFFVSSPDAPLFGSGSGQSSFSGTQAFIPMFRIQGNGPNQNFLLSVAASGVLNNGDGAPAVTLFTRGSVRAGGDGTATRIGQSIGSLNLDNGPGTPTRSVFGTNDEYMILTNSGNYFADDDPEDDDAVSFFQNVTDNSFETFGNLHIAQRQGSQLIAPNARIGIGTTPQAYAQETGRAGAAAIGANDARFLSFTYSSNAAVFRDAFGGSDKLLLRTSAIDFGGAAAFSLRNPTGSIALIMDETLDSSLIDGALFTFGGGRGAVIDDARFVMRENRRPSDLTDVLIDSNFTTNVVDTIDGAKTGRPPNEFGEAALRGALISHGLADSSSLYPAGTPLTPEYLTWGWWTGQFRFDGDPNAVSDPFNNARLQMSLGTWIAGDRTNVLPVTGTATYDGPVTVNVLDGAGADFVDGGRFQMNWNFASQAGSAGFQNVADLPNFNVPVSVQGAAGVNDYGGNQLVGAGMADVRVDGSFFDGPNANDALATAGSIRVDDSLNGRVMTGTFWGER